MSLYNQLLDDLKQSMLSKKQDRVLVLRSIKASILEKQIELKSEARNSLPDEMVLNVLQKQAKKRRDSIEQFDKAGRHDLVEAESAQLKIVEEYLPQMMSEAEVETIVTETIQRLGVNNPSDMGKVMGALMPKLKGKADGALISKVVKSKLSTQ